MVLFADSPIRKDNEVQEIIIPAPKQDSVLYSSSDSPLEETKEHDLFGDRKISSMSLV
jgi:hypothetical protein